MAPCVSDETSNSLLDVHLVCLIVNFIFFAGVKRWESLAKVEFPRRHPAPPATGRSQRKRRGPGWGKMSVMAEGGRLTGRG